MLYQFHTKTYQTLDGNTSGNADVETGMDGVQIAYTMGGATLRISDVSVSNGFTANNSEDRTEIGC